MKNKIKLLFSAFLLVLLVVSCDKLERFPTNQIERSQSFETLADAKSWNNGMYARLRGNLYGSRMFTLDIQADQLNATLTYGNRNGSPHRWTEFLANTGILQTVWLGYYRGIADVNVAINGFKNIKPSDASETAELSRYEGEAHFVRALYYHNLVVRYGKMYNPSSAATDLGVPIYLDFDVTVFGERKSVKAVYDQVLSDISVAKSKLASVAGTAGATRLSIDAVKALEARVKFYMQDWKGAKTIADELIGSGKYPLIKTAAGLKAMWHTDSHQEVITALKVSNPNELPNVNIIYLGFISATKNFAPDFLPSQWVVDKYDANDFRKNVYFEQKVVEQNAVTYPGVWAVNKYPGNPALYSGNTNYAHSPILFRIAEMYLISAESALNIPGADALTPLNALRTARNLTALAGITGPVLTDAVRDERFRELAFEGFRLDDLRRWNLGFTRRLPQNTTLINTGSDFDAMVRTASDPKFTWGIPTLEITANPNIGQQNAGW
ncbi:MAG: RagB/SusD family nutrient uptake outer membrane protein [Flavobacteriaceae bacterium]|nr:RagB/SusD family nutrient uptake outer membrane protein [Flavobacteriaceae bacterium]